MTDLYALPKDTVQDGNAYKVRQKIPTGIFMKYDPLDRRSTRISQFHLTITIHSGDKNPLKGQKT